MTECTLSDITDAVRYIYISKDGAVRKSTRAYGFYSVGKGYASKSRAGGKRGCAYRCHSAWKTDSGEHRLHENARA